MQIWSCKASTVAIFRAAGLFYFVHSVYESRRPKMDHRRSTLSNFLLSTFDAYNFLNTHGVEFSCRVTCKEVKNKPPNEFNYF